MGGSVSLKLKEKAKSPDQNVTRTSEIGVERRAGRKRRSKKKWANRDDQSSLLTKMEEATLIRQLPPTKPGESAG